MHRNYKRKGIVLLLLALVCAGIAAMAAYAYFTSTANSNTATSTLPTQSACTSIVSNPPAGQCSLFVNAYNASTLYPGATVPVTFKVEQNTPSPQRQFSLVGATTTITTNDPLCLPAWFTTSGYAWTSATGGGSSNGGGGAASFTPTIATLTDTGSGGNLSPVVTGTMNLAFAETNTNQSACAGKTVSIVLHVV